MPVFPQFRPDRHGGDGEPSSNDQESKHDVIDLLASTTKPDMAIGAKIETAAPITEVNFSPPSSGQRQMSSLESAALELLNRARFDPGQTSRPSTLEFSPLSHETRTPEQLADLAQPENAELSGAPLTAKPQGRSERNSEGAFEQDEDEEDFNEPDPRREEEPRARRGRASEEEEEEEQEEEEEEGGDGDHEKSDGEGPNQERGSGERERGDNQSGPVPSDLPKNVSNLPPETEIPEHLREPLVIAALRLAGEAVTRANIAAVLDRVQREEDTWQTNKPNLDDSNAANGTPSIGPMQIIQPTFDEHHVPGYNDINNPLHSMAAAIRYAREVYGGIQNLIGAENY